MTRQNILRNKLPLPTYIFENKGKTCIRVCSTPFNIIAECALQAAKQLNKPIFFEYEGTELECKPTTTINKLYTEYMQAVINEIQQTEA